MTGLFWRLGNFKQERYPEILADILAFGYEILITAVKPKSYTL